MQYDTINNITKKADAVTADIQKNIRNHPVNSLAIAGLAGVGIVSLIGCLGKFISRCCSER